MGMENLARSAQTGHHLRHPPRRHGAAGSRSTGDGRDRDPAGRLRGFLRSPEGSYLAGPGRHLHQPPLPQIRRSTCCTATTDLGPHPAAEGRRALLRAGSRSEINFDSPENARSKVLFVTPHAAAPDAPLPKLRARHGAATEDPHARNDLTDRPSRKGQSRLIVSPPKAGKTMLAAEHANSITG